MGESKDLSYLFEDPVYRQNADFVIGCYRDILNSAPDIDGLFLLCRQLRGFYTRKSLIVAIADSKEFAGRFEIKDLQKYRKEAYLPRAMRYLTRECRRKLCLSETGKFFGLNKRICFGYPTYPNKTDIPDPFCEFDMLSGCRIDTLRDEIEKLVAERYSNVECVGSMARELTGSSDNDSETAILTSVKDIVDLINGMVPERIKKFRTLLVTIPQPMDEPGQNKIDVVWDKSWRDVTENGKDSHRWLLSGHDGEIILLNRQNNPVMINIEFHLYCFYDHSVVRICQGDQSMLIPVRKMIRKVKIHTILTPGVNPISFQYIASIEGGEKNTSASMGIGDLIINGSRVDMGQDMRHLGTGYYEALFTDDKVRSVLHKNGYAEIESIRVYKDSTVIREKTTRFLEYGPNSIARCYYTLDPGETDEGSRTGDTVKKQSSVRLYIVKKAASMTPLNNPIIFT